jgi:aspartate/tyrosine/aromatic aminotransferase
MFETLTAAPPDAILGLTEDYKKDPRSGKINLGVGVYQDAMGRTPILKCVKAAERQLLESETSKSYLAIDGLPDYARQVPALLFGEAYPLIGEGRLPTVQTPGGTAALRIAAEFVRRVLGKDTIWCSAPTWANHPSVFAAAGLQVRDYAYFDTTHNALDFEAMIADLKQIPAGDVVLLHGC